MPPLDFFNRALALLLLSFASGLDLAPSYYLDLRFTSHAVLPAGAHGQDSLPFVNWFRCGASPVPAYVLSFRRPRF